MICCDANVLIEVILGRRQSGVCRKYIEEAPEDLAITMLSLDLIMYYAERHKLDLKPFEQLLRLFVWLPLTESDAEQAFKQYKGDDFEDALQISCTIREGCSKFATLDKSLAKKYSQSLPIDLLA